MTARLKLTKTEMKNALSLGLVPQYLPDGSIVLVPVNDGDSGNKSKPKVEPVEEVTF